MSKISEQMNALKLKAENDLKKSKRKRTIISIIIYFILISFLVIVIFSEKIFGEDNWLSQKVSAFETIVNYLNENAQIIFDTILYIIIIIILSKIIRFILRLTQSKMKRGKAVINLINSFIKYMTGLIVIIMILKLLGVDTSALITSIGILGLIVGLGAQSLIEDIISGLFIVFEKTFDVGDVVVFDGFRGTIKEIGLRTTKLLDVGGDVLTINNSDIRKIINMTSDLSVAICDVSIDYGESIENVEELIKKNISKFKVSVPLIVEGPYYLGINELGDSGVIIRIIAKCNEKDRYQVVRDLNREIKILFDKNNITIPFPQIVVNKPKSK